MAEETKAGIKDFTNAAGSVLVFLGAIKLIFSFTENSGSHQAVIPWASSQFKTVCGVHDIFQVFWNLAE